MSYLDAPACDLLEISDLDKFLEEISDLTESGWHGGQALPVSQASPDLCSQSLSLCDRPIQSQATEHSTSTSQHELQHSQNLKQPTKRSAAWTAKNRRAQQRFREKQKAAKTSLQHQLEEKQHCLHKLQQMRTDIAADNKALEKLLDTQKMAIDILQGTHKAQDSNADEPSCSMPHSQLILQESALTAESLHHQQLTDEMPVSANCPSLLAAEAPAAFVEGLERVLAVLDSENGLAQDTVQEPKPPASICRQRLHLMHQGLANTKEQQILLKASEQEQGAMAIWSDLQVLTKLSQLNIT